MMWYSPTESLHSACLEYLFVFLNLQCHTQTSSEDGRCYFWHRLQTRRSRTHKRARNHEVLETRQGGVHTVGRRHRCTEKLLHTGERRGAWEDFLRSCGSAGWRLLVLFYQGCTLLMCSLTGSDLIFFKTKRGNGMDVIGTISEDKCAK